MFCGKMKANQIKNTSNIHTIPSPSPPAPNNTNILNYRMREKRKEIAGKCIYHPGKYIEFFCMFHNCVDLSICLSDFAWFGCIACIFASKRIHAQARDNDEQTWPGKCIRKKENDLVWLGQVWLAMLVWRKHTGKYD